MTPVIVPRHAVLRDVLGSVLLTEGRKLEGGARVWQPCPRERTQQPAELSQDPLVRSPPVRVPIEK